MKFLITVDVTFLKPVAMKHKKDKDFNGSITHHYEEIKRRFIHDIDLRGGDLQEIIKQAVRNSEDLCEGKQKKSEVFYEDFSTPRINKT